MPRKQSRGYRRGYKRTYKKRTLKKSNIFSKKSATSQAKQIYALNKKINYIEKKTRPEIKVVECPFITQLFTTDGNLGSYGIKEWHTRVYIYEDRLFNPAFGGYTLQGSMLRPQNITISGLFENKNHNVEVNGKIYDPPLTGYLRIVVCRLYGGNQGRYPDQITKSYDVSTNDIGLIMGPLEPGVSASMKIIRNKVIKIDKYRDNRMFKIVIKNPGTYRQGITNSSTVVPAFKNEYLIYFQYFCPDQFFEDGYQGTKPLAPIQRLSTGIKFAFVDDD